MPAGCPRAPPALLPPGVAGFMHLLPGLLQSATSGELKTLALVWQRPRDRLVLFGPLPRQLQCFPHPRGAEPSCSVLQSKAYLELGVQKRRASRYQKSFKSPFLTRGQGQCFGSRGACCLISQNNSRGLMTEPCLNSK